MNKSLSPFFSLKLFTSPLLLGAILLLLISPLKADNVVLKNKSTLISFNDKGFFASVKVNDVELLSSTKYPLLTLCHNGQLVLPNSIQQINNQLILSFLDGNKVVLAFAESSSSISLEVVSIANQCDALLFGPLELNINEVVGDIIGVVQGKGVAFGIQALNIKTNAGIPIEYADAVMQFYDYQGIETSISTSTIPPYRLAATHTQEGAMLQFSCRNRSNKQYRKVVNVNNALTLPVMGEDANIKGAKIAFFGCESFHALDVIGLIEEEYNLPHPLLDGVWAKTNPNSKQSYLITNFSEETLDFVINKALRAGFNYIYQMSPFEDWGHFNWDQDFVKGGDEQVKNMVDYARRKSVNIGIHTLSNFITVNDAFVSPNPSPHLLKQAELQLVNSIDASQTEIEILNNDYFSVPATLNVLQIENELLTWGNVEIDNDIMVLKNCKRGAYGTTASNHDKRKVLYKLWDYPYKTLFPDLALQDSMADRLVDIFNRTGLLQISFDGLEGCTYTGQDDYATARFVMRCYEGWNNSIINDASNLNHFTWHVHTRMNWGEPWGEEMRVGQVENRIKNQDFFKRNLFPAMLGWFQIRLADKKFACTSLEDVEWALSEAAGFDAGYAMTINMKTLQNHGIIDDLLEAIHNWDYLRYHNAFTEEQKRRLRDPLTEWHLKKNDENNYMLYPLFISSKFHCNLNEMQPGHPGGADWSLNSPYGGSYAISLFVEGEGKIVNPTFITPQGTIKFPCTLNNNQYLLYRLDGVAVITSENFVEIERIFPQGKSQLNAGTSSVSFSCDAVGDEKPTVIVKFITSGEPESIIITD